MLKLENPGSIIEFASRNNLSPEEVTENYSRELDIYRKAIAQSMGISLEELHNYRFNGQLAVETTSEGGESTRTSSFSVK